ncbi:hypothetical protein GPDM_10350 [Planococcus donghaensis MPA1U2]|uniref:Peptidase M20 dimerisation domain-containing protein n=1 Tax=Planococcus donghaensis MPA1U2 TaxID=933115 RepID=E7RHW2_9BACL|nr:M20/M25/M40 family metallo-hydrolase [Planococcus donghaensis]EGA89392.1 hypothetical protein GPDM_10350 [Planococcus donghaensis MPA1U2]
MDSLVKKRVHRLLTELIRADTSNELANEIEAAEILQVFFAEYDIHTEILYSPHGRANLIAVLDGDSSTDPIVLLSHLDVVGPGEKDWVHPPFSGKVEDGVLWGRGALDTKQLTAMHAGVMVELKKQAQANGLRQNVIFLATADEENGSAEGMGFLVNEIPHCFKNATIFSEGGGFTSQVGAQRYMFVAAGEKGTATVKVKANGEGGHAGAPPSDQALLHLLASLTNILQKTFNPPQYPILSNYIEHLEAVLTKEEHTDENEIFLFQMRDYMMFPTVTVQNVNVGNQINVIPYYAEAEIEIRVLPMTTEQELKQQLSTVLDSKSVSWELLSFQQGYESNIDSSALSELEKHSANMNYPLKVLPFTALGKTDGRFIGQLAKDIYGISPVKIPFIEVLKRVHKENERIELDSFDYGLELLWETIVPMAQKRGDEIVVTKRESRPSNFVSE